MALTDLSKHIEAVEQFINDLAETFRKRRWVKILSIFGVVFAVFLNPSAVEYLKIFEVSKPQWYSYRVWGIGVILLFVIAFVIALYTKKEKEGTKSPTAISIIKGLLPYTNTKEDAEWFTKLQRSSILHDCVRFCMGVDSSFAIFSGESGAGKTSLLQAGLLPNLDTQKYQPVYVKLTDKQPLHLIRCSLIPRAEEPIADDNQTLLALLRLATRDNSRSIIMILDQFEQFFTHHKSKEARKGFIEQMAEWHKQCDSLSVKIIISIRGDFANRLNEFQQEMKYTLTPHNNLSIEKFQPQEAARVISTIAKEANIEIDESFVVSLTKHELADHEDGTVSPVDIQILCWMVDGQKDSEERAFNLKAFQKLGGVEGLLERFLGKALGARETDTRRQAAIKVMLALTDQHVRAGTLSMIDLKKKLSNVISDEDIEEAVSWLVKAEVRLITAIQEKNTVTYELAHERIIPSLRRLAFKEITDAEKAQQILDRRVNEWIGNNRASRFLLTYREWRLIKRYWAIIILGSQKEQKKEFVSLSKRHFVTTGLKSIAALGLGISGYVGYKRYEEWYVEQYPDRPQTKIQRPQEKLVELVKRNRSEHKKVILYAVLLLSTLENEEDQVLYSEIWDQVVTLTPSEQISTLSWLAKAYIKLGKVDDKLAKALEKFRREVDEEKYSKIRVPLLQSLAKAYVNLGNTNEALIGLDKIFNIAIRLDPYERTEVLSTLITVHSRLPKTDKTITGLDKIQKATESYKFNERASVLSPLIDAYKRLGRSDKARNVLDNFYQDTKTRDMRDQLSVLPQIVKEYRDLGMRNEAERILAEGFQSIQGHDPANQPYELSRLAEANSILNSTGGGAGGGGGSYDIPSHVISPLVNIAVQHAKQKRLDEALRIAAKIPYEPDEISALCKILIIWRNVKDMDALEEMFEEIDKQSRA